MKLKMVITNENLDWGRINPAFNFIPDGGSKMRNKTASDNFKTSQLTGSIHRRISKNNLGCLFRQIFLPSLR